MSHPQSVHPQSVQLAARWWYAGKPRSWPKLLAPALLGQAMGLQAGRAIEWCALLFGACFTWFGMLFIVLMNDWGDRDIDAVKRRMFPDGCSPKTIPDRILPAQHVLWAGVGCSLVAAGSALLGAPLLGRPFLAWGGIASMWIFYAYTFPPLQLNYRGGGEFLEMLGVGCALPWLNAYAQGGMVFPPTMWLLPGGSLLAFSSAVASGLADEQSDRRGGKRTLTTHFGNGLARRTTETALLLGSLCWLMAAAWLPGCRAAVPAAVWVLAHYPGLRQRSNSALTNAFQAQARYKSHLHQALWYGSALLAVGLVTQALWLG